MNFKRLTSIPIALAVAALVAIPTNAITPTVTVYDSIPSPLPPNFPSVGYEATSTKEFGDQIQFAGTARSLSSVTVGMSDWALHSDYPTMPDPWQHPITLNLYDVDHTGAIPVPGTLIATKTQTFNIPWRPEPNCPAGGTAWLGSDGICYNGFAFEITFDMASLHLTLPNEIIYGIVYNTADYGPAPLHTPGPYNSLNVGAPDIVVNSLPTVGTDVESDAVFWNTSHGPFYSDGGAGGIGIFRRDANWTPNVPAARFNTIPSSASINPTTSTFCTGENSTLNINLNDVVNMYGYQFQVQYDPTVSASAAFVNSFFDTTDHASPVPSWEATCTGGVCQFAVSKTAPGLPVSGSGTVASVTFTGVTPGTANVTFKNGLLSDRDGMPTTVADATANLTVCGYASVSGKVSLQGRVQPGPQLQAAPDAGTVTLTDGAFGPYTTAIDQTTGNFTFNNIKVMPTGTDYTIAASHWLYLTNQKVENLIPGENMTSQNTKLLGGDADNNKVISIGDLSCIGGTFNLPPAACGTGWTDINNDGGLVNIQDLSIAGGNYDKPILPATTLPW